MEKKELRRIVARNVRHNRYALKMTQEQLAEKCELSPRYISDIENRKGNIPIDTLEKIAIALKVKPYQLVKNNIKNSSSNTSFRRIRNPKVTIKKK